MTIYGRQGSGGGEQWSEDAAVGFFSDLGFHGEFLGDEVAECVAEVGAGRILFVQFLGGGVGGIDGPW